jgi:hypothetical protein
MSHVSPHAFSKYGLDVDHFFSLRRCLTPEHIVLPNMEEIEYFAFILVQR